jgi:hypothetical protein
MSRKLYSLCGLECSDCPGFLARKFDNPELRVKTAKKWSKAFGWDLKPEDINCVGCVITQGPHFIHCQEHCAVRKCGLEKGLVNCGGCTEYDNCQKIASLHKVIHEGKAYCDKMRVGR